MSSEELSNPDLHPRRRPRQVCLIESEDLIRHCDRIPSISGRSSRVASLISSCGLHSRLTLLTPRLATREELVSFHSQDYVDFLRKISESQDPELLEEEADANFGLGFDCPPIPDLYNFCLAVAGGSISAAEALTKKTTTMATFDVAINWFGGWHHAQRDSAEGFCYINDIVMCVHELRKRFDKVLYLDLDVHHGNGVENAFLFSPKVFTLSIHLREPGFYPGSGDIGDVGLGKGKGFCMNIPLLEGVSDEAYVDIFNRQA